ncbi:MAG: metal ABC transporter substrate-binding protein [Actinomycetota bacterium]
MVSNVLLGSVAQEIVGPEADVVVLIPNGVDPHLYEPSARDIERLNNADLVVINGLGLESSLEESLAGVRAKQIPIFEATDHIDTHEALKNDDHSESELHEGEVESDKHADEKVVGEHDGHLHSEDDPHFWTDPRLMADVVRKLGVAIEDLGLDIGDSASMLSERLLTFDQDMLDLVETLPADRRVLVTGHESLGYFAERYGFEIVGTIIPGLSTGAEVSAANLSAVKDAIDRSRVGVIFTELGTSSESARVLSDELDVEVVDISTHFIPEEALQLGVGGDMYMKFIEMLVTTIVSALEK